MKVQAVSEPLQKIAFEITESQPEAPQSNIRYLQLSDQERQFESSLWRKID